MSIDLVPVAICVGLARSVTNVLARLSTTYDHRGSYSLLPVGKFDALRVVPCETRPSFDRSMRRRLSIVQGEVAPMIRHWSGGRQESHPPAPTDPYVSLSAHTALLTQWSERNRPPPVRE